MLGAQRRAASLAGHNYDVCSGFRSPRMGEVGHSLQESMKGTPQLLSNCRCAEEAALPCTPTGTVREMPLYDA